MKMNVSVSAGFLKPVTGFLKKYTPLLPSIGIAAAALFLLIPTMLVGKSVKKQMETSTRTANNVASLLREVPSRETPEQIKRYMDRLEEETKQIETLAVESSMRELISYDVFPPKGTSTQLYVNFGNKYRTAIENLIKTLNASDAPSDNEINSQIGAGNQPDMGGYSYRGGGESKTGAVSPMLEALCQKRSQEISVYGYPSVFPWYDFWEKYEFTGQNQAVEDCWDAQVSYWIYEDVVETIRKMNEGSQTVSTSPVKRLLGVSFSGPVDVSNLSYRRMGMGEAGGFRDKPNYVLPEPAMTDKSERNSMQRMLLSNFVGSSLTNRAGNEDVDVVHFAVSVLVDNRAVMPFIKELCSEKPHRYRVDFKEEGPEKAAAHNQIAILKSELSVVNKRDPVHELYRYGDGAVMQLDLVCEYQFIRKGYDRIKPDSVREMLGQPVTKTGGTATGGYGFMPE